MSCLHTPVKERDKPRLLVKDKDFLELSTFITHSSHLTCLMKVSGYWGGCSHQLSPRTQGGSTADLRSRWNYHIWPTQLCLAGPPSITFRSELVPLLGVGEERTSERKMRRNIKTPTLYVMAGRSGFTNQQYCLHWPPWRPHWTLSILLTSKVTIFHSEHKILFWHFSILFIIK